MSAESIYNQLRAAGMSHNGACAMMGNMEAESGLKANIAQRGMTKLTDEQYTMLYNSTPDKCYNDSVGYGLCQWTYPQRKRNLRQFAYNWDVSVGTEDMQTAFAVYELKTEHEELWGYLCEDCDLYMATSRICKEFERPAVNNVEARYAAALKYKTELEEQSGEADMTILIIQALLTLNGYQVELSGQGDRKTLDALRAYMKTTEEI